LQRGRKEFDEYKLRGFIAGGLIVHLSDEIAVFIASFTLGSHVEVTQRNNSM